MKRKLFLLNMFLSTSILGGTVFNVISCKKAVKSGDESNVKTEVVIKEKTALIKQKIRAIIDDYTTNSNNEDNKNWIVNLQQIEYSEVKIERLKKAVKNMKDSADGKLISEVDSVLDEIIRIKIKQISQYVNDKLKLDNTLNLPSNFQIEINDEFEPMLTNFTSIKFIEAIEKLLATNFKKNSSTQINSNLKTYQNLENNEHKNQVDKIDKLTDEPDIFKTNTTFSYTFSYAGINETDEYKNVELLVTRDVLAKNDLKKYGYQQIQRVFSESIEERILIYDGNVKNENVSGQRHENLNIKFNWDFNDEKVRNEIKNIQLQKVVSVINNNQILKLFTFDPEKVEYKMINAMNFSNESIEKPLTANDKTVNLVYGSGKEPKNTSFSGIKKELLKQLGISERKIGTINSEEYYFNKDGENHYWDGGELNKLYVKNLKIDELIKEFYNEKNGQYLIGYGNLTMPRITFADLDLSPVKIKTKIIINETGFSYMIDSLLGYLEGLVNVLRNGGEPKKPGYELAFSMSNLYIIQWKFYNDEWKAIEKKIADTSTKQVSFNWIMKNVIYKIRALNLKNGPGNNILDLKQYWKDDAIPEEAIESFRTTSEILFTKFSEKELTWNESNNFDGWYFKFGPFKIFLSDSIYSRYAETNFSGAPIVKG